MRRAWRVSARSTSPRCWFTTECITRATAAAAWSGCCDTKHSSGPRSEGSAFSIRRGPAGKHPDGDPLALALVAFDEQAGDLGVVVEEIALDGVEQGLREVV